MFCRTLKQSTNESNSEGFLPVHGFNNSEPLKKAIMNAAQELGQPLVETFNERSYIGYNEVKVTQENGRRISTARAFLEAAKFRPNFHVIKGAVAKKINVAPDRTAKSISFVYTKEYELEVSAKKEIIVSAGAIKSPKLLMLSGIGPKKHLDDLGITLVKNPEVGNNLEDHVFVPLVLRFQESTARAAESKEMLDALYRYLVHGDGPLSNHGTLDLTAYINTQNMSEPYPDVEIHHFMLPKGNAAAVGTYANAVGFSEPIFQSILKANQKAHIIMVYIVLLNPKSVGKIRLSSTNFEDAPEISPNYLDRKDDLETLLRALKFQIKFQDTKAFKEAEGKLVHVDIPGCSGFEYLTSEYLKCYIRHMSTTVYHPTGTVKMGPDTDKTAVVDWRLRVKGIKGLRVADASIMPKIVSANTNAPTIMIAEKVSDFIKEDWRGESHEEL